MNCDMYGCYVDEARVGLNNLGQFRSLQLMPHGSARLKSRLICVRGKGGSGHSFASEVVDPFLDLPKLPTTEFLGVEMMWLRHRKEKLLAG